MARQRHAGEVSLGWSVVRIAAGLVGTVFLVLGVLGFIPGITTAYDQFSVAGPGPTAELFDVFAVSVVHNIIHLVLGVAGIASGLVPAPAAAQSYLVVGGGIVLVLAVYGAAAVTVAPYANIVPFNGADNWLHLGMGLGMAALGVLGTAVQRVRTS